MQQYETIDCECDGKNLTCTFSEIWSSKKKFYSLHLLICVCQETDRWSILFPWWRKWNFFYRSKVMITTSLNVIPSPKIEKMGFKFGRNAPLLASLIIFFQVCYLARRRIIWSMYERASALTKFLTGISGDYYRLFLKNLVKHEPGDRYTIGN